MLQFALAGVTCYKSCSTCCDDRCLAEMCICRYAGNQPVAAAAPSNDSEDEMTQCLRWVTDAYNEFLEHGKLSEERVNRLQMVYNKLASENVQHDGSLQTMSNLSTMMGTSNPAEMHEIPSLPYSRIPPPVSASAIPTIMGVSSSTATNRQNHRSRSRSVEKALLPTPDITDGRHLAQNKSQAQSSPRDCGLADGETMEIGSEDGGIPYSPFDSPFDLFDSKASSAAPHAAAPSESAPDSGSVLSAATKDHTPSSIQPNASPFSSAASDRGRAAPPQPEQPPHVLTPQDILAARIMDELALVEVLVRIQFELASIGDLSAEDAAEAGITVSGEPSTPPAPLQSPVTTAAAEAEPKSLVKDSLPALPSPSSLQQMLGQSATPPSTTPQSTAVSATLSQSSVSHCHSGKMLESAAVMSGKLPYTPPTDPPDAVQSPASAAPVSISSSKPSTTTTATKPQPSLSQQVKSSKPTVTSASSQRPKTSSAAASSQTVVKAASADGSEKVFVNLLVISYVMGTASENLEGFETPKATNLLERWNRATVYDTQFVPIVLNILHTIVGSKV